MEELLLIICLIKNNLIKVARQSNHHLLLEQRPRKVKEVVARDIVGIEVLRELKEEHKLMARHQWPKMMTLLWKENPEPAEIIKDREVKERLILHRIRVIPRNLQLFLILRMKTDQKL